MPDILALAKQRDYWIDQWLKVESSPKARRMLQEYLLDGRHRDQMPKPLIRAQDALMKEVVYERENQHRVDGRRFYVEPGHRLYQG